MDAKSIKSSTLKISGIFARLLAGIGNYTKDAALKDSLQVTEEIEQIAEAMEKDQSMLRRRVADLCKAKYQLRKDYDFVKKENETLKQKIERMQLDLSSYSEPYDISEGSQESTSQDAIPPTQIVDL